MSEDRPKPDSELLQREMFEKLQRESRKSAILGFVGGVVVMGGLGMTYFATIQAQKSLDHEKAVSGQLGKDLSKTSILAAQATTDAATTKKTLVAVVGNLQSEGGAVSAATQSAVNSALAANPEAAKLLPRVYIHMRFESQRTIAKELANTLRTAGYLVPGIDLGDAPSADGRDIVGPFKHTEIHYYTSDALSLKDSQAIAEVLTASGTPTTAKIFPNATKQLPRSYGLWLAADLQ